MLIAIGIEEKIVNIGEKPYDETESAVVIIGQSHHKDWCIVSVDVRQGCLLSPTLFNVFLEFVMDEVKSLQNSLV